MLTEPGGPGLSNSAFTPMNFRRESPAARMGFCHSRSRWVAPGPSRTGTSSNGTFHRFGINLSSVPGGKECGAGGSILERQWLKCMNFRNYKPRETRRVVGGSHRASPRPAAGSTLCSATAGMHQRHAGRCPSWENRHAGTAQCLRLRIITFGSRSTSPHSPMPLDVSRI